MDEVIVTWRLSDPESGRSARLYFAGMGEGIDMSPNAAAAVRLGQDEAREVVRRIEALEVPGLTDLRIERPPVLEAPSRCVPALLQAAHDLGMSDSAEDLPCLQGAVEPFTAVQADVRRTVATHPSRDLDRLVRLACEYLWGKGLEAALLWARSEDGAIEIGFCMEDLVAGVISPDLPQELIDVVAGGMAAMEPVYEAFQLALLQDEEALEPEAMGREVAALFTYIPLIAMAYAIREGLHQLVW